jgi:hypothetical protein
MKVFKIVLILIGAVIIILIALFAVYLLINRQGVVEGYDAGTAGAAGRLLIASQESKFKNALVERVIADLAEDSLHVRVIDVTSLGDIKENEWDAILMLHTTENWRLQPDVKKYLERAQQLDKVIIVTTSGSGEWKSDEYDVDILTSASKSDELPALTERITEKIRSVLE